MLAINFTSLALASLLATIVSTSPMAIDTRAAMKLGREYQGEPLESTDVLVATNGAVRVMTESAYSQMLKRSGVVQRDEDDIGPRELVSVPASFDGNIEDLIGARSADNSTNLDKRQSCDKQYSLVVDKTETFVDWDAQMSPVICAQGANMTVAIANGFSVTNTIQASASLTPTIVKDKLQASLGINYSKAWTTSTLITTTGTVKDGNCGSMVTRPIITRRSGRAFTGCVGKLTQTGTYQANSHKELKYGGVAWVEGAISMCSKPGVNPPLSRCSGSGNFT